jgi:endonuclease/exonuclease/phosphatase family metal-dependent hydrolase
MSSNIRYDNPQDGIHSWDSRKPLMQKIINNFQPDILGTQEGREAQIKSLAEIIPMALTESHREWIADRMYPCLFINEEQIKLIESGDIWLSETPDIKGSLSFKSSFPRLCTWMHITHLVNNQDYFIVNTHLDHILEETRIQQVNVLINEVKKKNRLSLPVILMGDFNNSPLGPIRKTLLEELHLKDPWIELGLVEETSHHGFNGSSATNGDRIDWILVPESFAVEEIRLEKISFENIFPSDHYPLLATVIPR